MVRHVVMFRWTDESTEQQRHAATVRLRKLSDNVPGIRRLSVGTDLGMQVGNFDLVLVADFDDEDGYARYRDHPEHRQVVRDYVAPIVASRAAVQCSLED